MSSEAVDLAFFDKTIGKSTKLQMIEAMNSKSEDYFCEKIKIDSEDVKNHIGTRIEHFISQNTNTFFERFCLT